MAWQKSSKESVRREYLDRRNLSFVQLDTANWERVEGWWQGPAVVLGSKRPKLVCVDRYRYR